MPTYKYTGSHPISIPALGLQLKPGEKFESEEKLNHSDFELIKQDKPKADDKATAKEG